jgi:protocatechuate 3,4-dioxygenase beta subunit
MHRNGETLGENIVVTDVVRDEDRKPVRNWLLKVRQCDATGRYSSKRDSAMRAAGS